MNLLKMVQTQSFLLQGQTKMSRSHSFPNRLHVCIPESIATQTESHGFQQSMTPGADPGFWSGGPSRVLTQGALSPKFAQNRVFSVKIAWKLHDFEEILGARGHGPPGPLPWICYWTPFELYTECARKCSGLNAKGGEAFALRNLQADIVTKNCQTWNIFRLEQQQQSMEFLHTVLLSFYASLQEVHAHVNDMTDLLWNVMLSYDFFWTIE